MSQARLERDYQSYLIKKLKLTYPEGLVLKNDSGYLQGIPDLTLLLPGFWATLEVKASSDSPEQPNQRYYVEKLGAMSFSAFIYPENEGAVLASLQQSYLSGGNARATRR